MNKLRHILTVLCCFGVPLVDHLFLVSAATVPTEEDTTPLSIGVYYYPWYDGPDWHWPQGFVREELNTPQPPRLGLYSNRDMAVVDQHLRWANQYNISQFICSWWGIDKFEDNAIRDYLLQSAELGNVQIALVYESAGLIQTRDESGNKILFDDDTTLRLVSEIEYMADVYFDHPNYLKVDGKPVIYFYVSRIFTGTFVDTFATVRRLIREKYGYDLYLVGDEVWWESTPSVTHITTFDAITAYNMHGPAQYEGYPEDTNFLRDVETQYSLYQAVAEENSVDFIPGIMPGFNDRAVRLEVDHYAIPHEMRADLDGTGQYTTFQESLEMARRIIQQSSNQNRTSSTIMITSFNEWHEDTNIEPTALNIPASNEPRLYTEGYTYEAYGFRLLEMISEFLGEDPPAQPDPIQEEDDDNDSSGGFLGPIRSICNAICNQMIGFATSTLPGVFNAF